MQSRKTFHPTRPKKPQCDSCSDDQRRLCRDCGCSVCGGKDDLQNQIICDECQDSFHLNCIPAKNRPKVRVCTVNAVFTIYVYVKHWINHKLPSPCVNCQNQGSIKASISPLSGGGGGGNKIEGFGDKEKIQGTEKRKNEFFKMFYSSNRSRS